MEYLTGVGDAHLLPKVLAEEGREVAAELAAGIRFEVGEEESTFSDAL